MNLFDIRKINNKTHIFQNKIRVTKDTYLNILKEVKSRNYDKFYRELEENYDVNVKDFEDEIHQIALYGQIQIKGSKIMYLHGFVVYAALMKYIKDHSEINYFNILETGTARGYSALCLAKALYDSKVKGKIYTVESIVPHGVKMYWNCIGDFEYGMTTREELFQNWKHLFPYIQFEFGDSKKILAEELNSIERFHFGFLDAQHDYDYLSYEMNWLNKKQNSGDIIVCDDYTFLNKGGTQYPGIIKAIDEFVKNNNSKHKIFYGEDGVKKRGYVVIKKT